MRITRLGHFDIYATDLTRAERFYRERLGTGVYARAGSEQVLMR